MTDQHAASRASVVLLVNRQEWTARSVESVLQPAGFAVVKAYTGRQAIELAARLRPDLVIVDFKLSDILGQYSAGGAPRAGSGAPRLPGPRAHPRSRAGRR